MKRKEMLSALLDISEQQVVKWEKLHPQLMFFLSSLSDEELSEVLEYGRIEKLDLVRNISKEKIIVQLELENKNEIIFNKMKKSFERASFVYLYFLLRENNKINNTSALNKFLNLKIEPKSFIESIKESILELKYDFDNNNFTRKGFALRLKNDLNSLTSSEIDHILNNRIYFYKIILLHINTYLSKFK